MPVPRKSNVKQASRGIQPASTLLCGKSLAARSLSALKVEQVSLQVLFEGHISCFQKSWMAASHKLKFHLLKWSISLAEAAYAAALPS